ncbi:MAG: MmcQ/YjbR family DNA-binding protein [Prevotella sp.]|nr:MmcQ/YjbR family DNA-binding protein [Prevotella sp.]
MNIEDVREYALTLPGAKEDMPYGPDWLIFRIEGKIFLHIWLESPEPTCAVKLEPEFGQSLSEHYDGVQPAYHLNKVHWNDIYLEMIDEGLTKQWIRQSYELVLSKLPKKLREKYL